MPHLAMAVAGMAGGGGGAVPGSQEKMFCICKLL